MGRRAQTANVVSLSDNLDTLQWQTETNPSLLAADGLPADTTFAWDMVSDQLIAVFNTNPQPGDPNAGLMRQIIHGGLTYDDPIEVTMLAGGAGGFLNRLYPVFDEAAAGSLQAVLNVDTQLVARNLPDDPAGAEDVSFAGATIDRASIHATKDSTGNLQSIDVTLHATEPLDPATLATGLRLASVNTNGVAVKTFAGTAQAVSGDAYSAKFTLSPTDWSTLNDSAAQALSIGVTPTLRAQGWANGLPILPPTDWAKLNGIFTTPTLPVEIRDSLSFIATFVAAISNSGQNTTTIYDVPSLALVGSTGTGADATSALFTAKFQALPFSDPGTGLVYARARWYSPETGTFLSGDPMAYEDSSDLYAFCGGDPINCSDPDGTRIRLNGDNPGADFLLFRRALNNPAAAAQLRIVHDKDGTWIDFKTSKEAFVATKMANPDDYDYYRGIRHIPTFDNRTIEEKMADIIASPVITEYRTGVQAQQWKDGSLRRFNVGSSEYGGGVTIEPWESVIGNTEIVVDPAHLGWGEFGIHQAFQLDVDPELAVIHEFGHAFAYSIGNPNLFLATAVEFENQMRARRGEKAFRWAEDPKDAYKGTVLPVGPRPTWLAKRPNPAEERARDAARRAREERLRAQGLFPCGREWCGDAHGW